MKLEPNNKDRNCEDVREAREAMVVQKKCERTQRCMVIFSLQPRALWVCVQIYDFYFYCWVNHIWFDKYTIVNYKFFSLSR